MIGLRLLEPTTSKHTGLPCFVFTSELEGKEVFVVRANTGGVIGAVVVSESPECDVMHSIGMPE